MTVTLVSIICVVLFAIHAVIMLGHRQKMGADARDKSQDPLVSDGRILLTMVMAMGAQLAAGYRRIWLATGAAGPWTESVFSIPANDTTLVVGTVIFFAGLFLRLWAIRILGRFFTFKIGIRSGHKIIEEGPYQFIRHPSYTGYLVMIVGMSLVYASVFFAAWSFFSTLFFLIIRMNQEEQMLVKNFGSSYQNYMGRTKRLVPFLY